MLDSCLTTDPRKSFADPGGLTPTNNFEMPWDPSQFSKAYMSIYKLRRALSLHLSDPNQHQVHTESSTD